MTPRAVALDTLIAVGRGERANVVVPAALGRVRLESRDRHLVTELVYGACRMQRACDWLIDRHIRGRVDDEVRAALRLGAYQIGWTRIPAHAAVSATVGEVRGPGRTVVNAVLRRVAADVANGLITWPGLATELSYPDWILDRLTADIGREAAVAALQQMNEPAQATVRADGYVQDEASQMVAAHLTGLARRSQGSRDPRLLDLCAAPGGKATAMAGSRAGLVVAADVAPARVALIAANAARLGTTGVAPVVADGVSPPFRPASFDLVLVDAPCSGLGVLRRRPDARWRVQPGDVERLAGLQRRLLTAASALARPGGLVAYSVCTLTAAETAAIDNWLSCTAPGLVPVPPPDEPWVRAGRGGLLLPQAAGTDGMYLLTLRQTTRGGPGAG